MDNATINADADLKLRSNYQQVLRGVASDLATNPVITPEKIADAKVAAGAQGVPSGIVQQFFGTMPRGDTPADQKKMKDWAVTQSHHATGPTATTSLTSGPINEQTGVRPLQPAGPLFVRPLTAGLCRSFRSERRNLARLRPIPQSRCAIAIRITPKICIRLMA